jgi:hypothetical protein
MVLIVSLNQHCQSGFVSQGVLTGQEGADMSSRIQRKGTTGRLFFLNPIVSGIPVVQSLFSQNRFFRAHAVISGTAHHSVPNSQVSSRRITGSTSCCKRRKRKMGRRLHVSRSAQNRNKPSRASGAQGPSECLGIDIMPKHDHHKAAAHHDEAATSHRKAAEAHEQGDTEHASQHSQIANEHSNKAQEASNSAHQKTKGPKTL